MSGSIVDQSPETEDRTLPPTDRETTSEQESSHPQKTFDGFVNYLGEECPEMELLNVFIERKEVDESSNNVRVWFKNGNMYEGPLRDEIMDGVGRYDWADGLSYRGEVHDNCLEGRGHFTWPDRSTYEGEVKHGMCHGEGTMRMPNGQVYSGQWNEGKKDGMGGMTYDDNGQEWYNGEWAGEKRHGSGSYNYGPANGCHYVGYWANGSRHGAGTAIWPDQKQMYSGYWDRGIQQGVGKHVWAAGRTTSAQYQLQNSYVGDWSGGVRHGDGTFCYAGGASYSGQWCENMKDGHGTVTFKNGQTVEGTFVKDRLVDGPGYIDIARTPDQKMYQRQLSRKIDNDETLSALLRSSIPILLNDPIFNVEYSDGSIVGPSSNVMESGSEAATNCTTVLLRFSSELRRIFSFYCDLAYSNNTSEPNEYRSHSLMRVLWWRLIKDARIPFSKSRLKSVADLDRKIHLVLNRTKSIEDIHDPFYPILFSDFLLWLTVTALFIEGYGFSSYLNQEQQLPVASVCLENFISDYILPNTCIIHGRLFTSQENSATTIRSLPMLMEFYRILSDIKKSESDMTVSGRQVVAVLVASGIAAATPAVKALAGNVFLSAESDCTSYVFAEITPLEVAEALSEVAEFINEGLMMSAPGHIALSTANESSHVKTESAQTSNNQGTVSQSAPEQQHEATQNCLGSILQESTGMGDEKFLLKSDNHNETELSIPFRNGRTDWVKIIQHLLSYPDLSELPKKAAEMKQTTLTAVPQPTRQPEPSSVAVSSTERSASPQGRAVATAVDTEASVN